VPTPAEGRFRKHLLLLTLAGLVVRLAFVFLEPATDPVADETMWTTWGAKVLPEVGFSPFAFRLIFHPPLYPYFIGAFAVLGGLTAVKLAQAVVSALLVPAVGRLGAAVFGPEAGLAAAAIAAFYPELVWFSAHFWVETVFTVLLWWGFERLVAADERASLRVAVAAGALFGLAILARETVLYFLPVAAGWLAWRRPGGGVRGAGFLLAAVLTVAPWTLRNWIVYGDFVPVSTAGALNLWQGNALVSRQEVYDQYWAVHGRIEKYRFARAKGLEAIRERQPGWFFEKLRQEMPNFWEADSQALVHVVRGAYGPYPRALAVAAVVVVLLPFFACLVGLVFGLAALSLARGPLLLVAFLAYYNLIHVAAHGYARYRLPAMPVLFLLAGFAWSAWRARTYPALSRPRRAVGLAAAVVLALSVAPTLASWFTHPWMDQGETSEAGEEAAGP
jgi:4-amino-4-deoxy-L-arabinose transferase-like glycosyltransferase